MVSEAHRLGVKIVAHVSEPATLRRLTANAHSHVDSIEHGYGVSALLTHLDPSDSIFPDGGLDTKPIFWVPTLATYFTIGKSSGAWDRAVQSFHTFLRKRPRGLRIACGGDTGVFAHGDNALEMKVMVRLGADWREVLTWCTRGGWECVRGMRWEGPQGEARLAQIEQLKEAPRIVGDNDVAFGAVRKGFVADIIATTGDLARNFENAVDKQSISFVMKAGKVYKQDGREINC